MVKLKLQQATSRLKIFTEANDILEVKINTYVNNKYSPIIYRQLYRPLAYLFYSRFQTFVCVRKHVFADVQLVLHAYLQLTPYLYKVNDIKTAFLYMKMYNRFFHIIHLYSNHALRFPADCHQYTKDFYTNYKTLLLFPFFSLYKIFCFPYNAKVSTKDKSLCYPDVISRLILHSSDKFVSTHSQHLSIPFNLSSIDIDIWISGDKQSSSLRLASGLSK